MSLVVHEYNTIHENRNMWKYSARRTVWDYICRLLMLRVKIITAFTATLLYSAMVVILEILAREGNNSGMTLPVTRGDQLCPIIPEDLVGAMSLDEKVLSWEAQEAAHGELHPGGRWKPRDCTPRYRVAIVIPYRDREDNLRSLLQHLHPLLQRHGIEYTIYVVEQLGSGQFNRGLTRNVGFMEAYRLDGMDCTIFHDVDLVPLDDRNVYTCYDSPRHMCLAVDYYQNFTPIYNKNKDMHAAFGGVVSLRNDHFIAVNGYSNVYFGWGGEDDDLFLRLNSSDIPPLRGPDHIGRYKGMPHKSDTDINGDRFMLVNTSEDRIHKDGISSLDYDVTTVERKALYTYIAFNFDEKQYQLQAREVVIGYLKQRSRDLHRVQNIMRDNFDTFTN